MDTLLQQVVGAVNCTTAFPPLLPRQTQVLHFSQHCHKIRLRENFELHRKRIIHDGIATAGAEQPYYNQFTCSKSGDGCMCVCACVHLENNV